MWQSISDDYHGGIVGLPRCAVGSNQLVINFGPDVEEWKLKDQLWLLISGAQASLMLIFVVCPGTRNLLLWLLAVSLTVYAVDSILFRKETATSNTKSG